MSAHAVRIEYSTRFKKNLIKAPLPIQKSFRRRREIFVANFYHPLLHNHKLTGKWLGYRSINITGDWRAIFSEKSDSILFVDIGTHSQLYRQ